MLDIESKIIAYHEKANDYRLCLTREDIEEIKKALNNQEQIRAEVIAEISREFRLLYGNEYEKQIRIDALDECLNVVEWDGYTLDIKRRIEQLK